MTWDSGEGVCSSSSFLCVLCSGTKDAEVSKSTLLRSQSCWWGLSFKYGIGQNIAQHAYKNSTFVSCVFPVHSFLCDSNLPSSFFSLQFPSSQFILFFAVPIFPVHSFLCSSHLPSSFFSLQFPSSQFILFFAVPIFPVHSFLCDSNLPSSFFSLQFPSSQFILYQPPKKTKLFSDIRLQFSGSVRLVIR